MASKLLWGWDPTNKVWVPLSVDANGRLKVDMTNINLDDLADVSVAAPADDDLFYFDNATSLWKSRKLVDADIPAAIARDTEVTIAINDLATAVAAAIAALELNDLYDVSVATPTDGQAVYWDNANSLWKAKLIDGSNLSQTFGASSARLANLIPTAISGEILRITNCSGSCFNAAIDDTPAAHGGQGLDATHVPYDGDTEENMFNGQLTYDGSAYWGQIVLHNTTRGNTRKIVSVDRTNNVITTSSSTDDWADNDVITTESQTNQGLGIYEYFDIDLSANVGPDVVSILLAVRFQNNTVNDNTHNLLFVHSYEAYDGGKRQAVKCAVGNEYSSMLFLVSMASQIITICVDHTGEDDFYVILTVAGTIEYADT